MGYPIFVAGNILTAADMNAVGMWLVKRETIGTSVANFTVSGAFSTDYDDYRIVISGGSASADPFLNMTLGSTATNYYWTYLSRTYNNTAVSAASTTGTFWHVGTGSTNGYSTVIDIRSPFLSRITTFNANDVYIVNSTAGAWYQYGGHLNNTTSYTAFTITASAGTLTGGTVSVYGYRK